MKLTHNIDEWHGTFGLTAKFMIEDLLSDGHPFKAKLTVDGGRTYQGAVLEITRTGDITIDLDNGTTEYVPLDELLAIEAV